MYYYYYFLNQLNLPNILFLFVQIQDHVRAEEIAKKMVSTFENKISPAIFLSQLYIHRFCRRCFSLFPSQSKKVQIWINPPLIKLIHTYKDEMFYIVFPNNVNEYISLLSLPGINGI